MPVKPLQDVTIIELSTMVTAAFAAMMAAEQGARVIKVEAIDGGDPMRYVGSSKGGSSGLFANSNRGKESVCVDLKQAEGQQLVRSLVAQADVVVTNFRPGVMEKLGLGSDVLRAANPRLIFLAVSGFGTNGPLAHAPAYDPVVQAHCGLAAVQGGDRAEFVRNLMCDKITAYTGCQALTAALFLRERTGAGQHIDLVHARCQPGVPVSRWIHESHAVGRRRRAAAPPLRILHSLSNGGWDAGSGRP